MFSDLGIFFLLAGYSLVVLFAVLSQVLRQAGSSTKSPGAGASDRRSTQLVSFGFGLGLILPIVLDVLAIGLYPLALIQGLLATAGMILGLGLRVWSARTLGKYYTKMLLTTKEQRVVTDGPYSKVRHPGYLGTIITWSSFGVLSSNEIIAFLFPVLFVAIYLYRISVEEKMLVEAMGEDYRRYQKRTSRLVPFIY